MIRRTLLAAAMAAAALASAAFVSTAAAQQRAICYNCPPEWADWGSQLKAIQARLGIAVPPDNKNSGQTLSALIAEKSKPVADIAYFGGTFGEPARAAGVLALLLTVLQGAVHSGYLFENWKRLRAPFCPYFLRSLIRGSRVTRPACFSVGRRSLLYSMSARVMP